MLLCVHHWAVTNRACMLRLVTAAQKVTVPRQWLQGDGEHAEADMCVLPPRPPPDVAVAEDIGGEFTAPLALSRAREGPRVINVGIPGTPCSVICALQQL